MTVFHTYSQVDGYKPKLGTTYNYFTKIAQRFLWEIKKKEDRQASRFVNETDIHMGDEEE